MKVCVAVKISINPTTRLVIFLVNGICEKDLEIQKCIPVSHSLLFSSSNITM